MNEPNSEQLKTLFESLERCHTIMADAFPHEGLKAIGGSRIFLRDPLMEVLKKCVKEVMTELRQPAVDKVRNEVATLWAEVAGLLTRIEGQDLNKKKADEINKAATLLYLANGITWNCLREFASGEPPHNTQYVRVEPMLPLLKRCGWQSEDGKNIAINQIVQRLQAELRACLRIDTIPLRQ